MALIFFPLSRHLLRDVLTDEHVSVSSSQPPSLLNHAETQPARQLLELRLEQYKREKANLT